MVVNSHQGRSAPSRPKVCSTVIEPRSPITSSASVSIPLHRGLESQCLRRLPASRRIRSSYVRSIIAWPPYLVYLHGYQRRPRGRGVEGGAGTGRLPGRLLKACYEEAGDELERRFKHMVSVPASSVGARGRWHAGPTRGCVPISFLTRIQAVPRVLHTPEDRGSVDELTSASRWSSRPARRSRTNRSIR